MDTPYITRDFAEAVTLATCGIPFYDPKRRMAHTYRASVLKEKGLSVKEAQARGVEGDKVWIFRKTQECDQVVKIFKDAWGKDRPPLTELANLDLPDLARAVSSGLRNRKELSGDWKFVSPNVAIQNGDQVIIINEATPKDVLSRWGVEI